MSIRELALFGLVAAGFLLPLLWGLRELYFPRDRAALDIDATYTKDDRFFARSFRKRIESVCGVAPRVEGLREVKLMRPEQILTTRSNHEVRRGNEPNAILDVQGDLRLYDGVNLGREASVLGAAVIGSDVSVVALTATGDIRLGERVRVERWLDSDGTIETAASCDLGSRATASRRITVASGTVFQILAAPLIVAGGTPAVAVRHEGGGELAPLLNFVPRRRSWIRGDGAVICEGDFELPEGTTVEGDLVVRGSVKIGAYCRLHGSLHADGNVLLGARSHVSGSAICVWDVRLGEESSIGEHLVTEAWARLDDRASVGKEGRVTTLLAAEGVEIAPGATIHGRIVTMGHGRVL